MLSINDLCKFKGIGHAKAITIIASLEIGRRRRADDITKPKVTIKSSSDAYDIVYASLSDKNYEEFWVILLNRANHLIKIMNISEGGISGTIADPKKIFRLALENNSSAIILAHNHPSNNLKPSESDLKLTKTIYKAGETLEINVLDHIIVGSDNYFSFADESLM
jgi:DNA repair protein RadC